MSNRLSREKRYARELIARELSLAEESLRRAAHHLNKAKVLEAATGEGLPNWAHLLLTAHERLERTR